MVRNRPVNGAFRMEKQTLGVIGGMGPEATAYFYEQVIQHTHAASDQEHLDMVILSCASMPDRTASIQSGDHEPILACMHDCVRRLEACGASVIAIPCNTSHYYYDTIQGFTQIPIIHMPRETVRFAVRGGDVRRIGIMGTDGTVQAGVYARECERAGVEAVNPSPERQADVMSLIYDDVKAGRTPRLDKLERVLGFFESAHCDRIILACTELSVLNRYRTMPDGTIDAMDVLVHESIVRCGGTYQA